MLNVNISNSSKLNKIKVPYNWPNINDKNMQKYLYNFYRNNKSEYQPIEYNELNGFGNRCIENTSNSSKLSLIQSSTYMLLKGIAEKESDTRGMLIYHSTGSGKTVVATSIMDAFWETKKKIIYLSSVEALKSNSELAFHKEAGRFFPRFNKTNLKYNNWKEKQTKIAELFSKRHIEFLTFAKLSHKLLISHGLKRVKTEKEIIEHKNYLNNAVLIIDEVQNIFKPLPNQRDEHLKLRDFLSDYKSPYIKGLKVFILTATPGDSPKDIVELLNFIRPYNSEPIKIPNINDNISLNIFRNRIAGLVSYLDASYDYSKFPRKYYMPPQIAYMKPYQFEKYAEKLLEMKDEEKSFEALEKLNKRNEYYKTARRYSNMLYEFAENMTIKEFSTKLPLLLQNIFDYPNEKHYIYSSFYINRGYGGQGINAIANILQQYGYKQLTINEAKRGFNSLTKDKRYILLTSKELNKNYSESETNVNLDYLKEFFNDSRNVYGEYAQLFLASQKYYESIHLKAVRNVHIFEPLLALTMEKQLIGRSVRLCSHADLDKNSNEWNVKIWKYYADFPSNLNIYNVDKFKDKINNAKEELLYTEKNTERSIQLKNEIESLNKELKKIDKLNYQSIKMVDKLINKEAILRSKEMLKLNKIIQESAVDCILTKDFHKIRKCSFE